MEIETDITRVDLIKLSLLFLLREKSNLVVVGVFAAGVFIYLLFRTQPDEAGSVVSAAGVAIAAGFAGFVTMFLISLVFIVLTSSQENGVLGKHTYWLTEEGLHERTAANEGLQRWQGFQAVVKSNDFIILRINSYLVHVIPRRAFTSEQAFELFWSKASDYWQAAQQGVPANPPD